jgi:hypothetical protein
MAARPFVVTREDRAPALSIVGEQLTILASGEATQGYEIFHQAGPEGSGAEAMTATAGTLVHLPAGTVHWFRFGKGDAEMISMTSRLGASKMFTDMAREIAPVDPDLGQLAEVGGRHGLKVEA